MEIISSSRNIVLSNFPSLETKFTYQPSEYVDTVNDFQFFGLGKVFLSVNRKSGIEILRKSDESTGGIFRLKKVQVKNIFCASSPNSNDCNELAIGLSDGDIRFLNYKTFESKSYFPSDPKRTSVVNLDYNASDDYLSAVYESGMISIYGMKTRTKLETLTFDKTCTLTKFHPIKRFHLGITTYKGGVYIYDVNTKHDIYNYRNAHTSPCRDIAMCAGCPDKLISVGFDCLINVIDVRKKNSSLKIERDCPLSAVTISECGNYVCVGNLKGEIQSFDIRNVQKILYSKKVHDTAIVRIGFVPNQIINEDIRKSISNNLNVFKQRPTELNYNDTKSDVTSLQSTVMNVNSNNSNTKRDSFFEFIDICLNNNNNQRSENNDIRCNQNKIETITQQQQQQENHLQQLNSNSNVLINPRRDSFLDFIDACTSKSTTNDRNSLGAYNLNLSKKDSNDHSLNHRVSGMLIASRTTETIPEDIVEETNEEDVVFISNQENDDNIKNKKEQFIKENKTSISFNDEISTNKTTTSLDENSNSNKNENYSEDNENFTYPEKMDISLSDNDDKENKQNTQNKQQQKQQQPQSQNSKDISNVFSKDIIIEEFSKLSDDKNSTPNYMKSKLNIKNETLINNTNTNINKMWTDIKEEILDLRQEIKGEIHNLRQEMLNQFKESENEIKFNADTNKWQLLNQNAHLFSKQQSVNEQIEEALFYLLKTDEFLNNYIKLKHENEELKKKLSQLSEKSKTK